MLSITINFMYAKNNSNILFYTYFTFVASSTFGIPFIVTKITISYMVGFP